MQLSFDLLESWLAENPDASQFKRNGESIFKELALFQDYHGIPEFKKALVEFMGEIRGNKVSFNANNLVLTAGATSANETLMFCLAESGDAFLLPTPYYPGYVLTLSFSPHILLPCYLKIKIPTRNLIFYFICMRQCRFDRDLKWRTGVEIVPIHCSSSNGFRITESALEEAYLQAKKQNLRVKGVLVTNPSNPLGTSLSRQELNLLLNFISAKGIHLISDEIYSGTVFNSPNFVSVMEVLLERNFQNTQVWNRVHMVYSLSKDLGLPGFRVGAIYSNHDAVVSAATKMSSFGLVSSQTQYLLSAMLSDKKFTKDYILLNQSRLKQRHAMLIRGLEKAGISCLESNAGLFCWVDMRHLLTSKTFEAEIELWKKIVYQVGLNISPGSSCHCSEPGWFRMCFANMSEETLDLAMRRIKDFVESRTSNICTRRGQTQSNKNSVRKSFTKWVFRLSFHDRESER